MCLKSFYVFQRRFDPITFLWNWSKICRFADKTCSKICNADKTYSKICNAVKTCQTHFWFEHWGCVGQMGTWQKQKSRKSTKDGHLCDTLSLLLFILFYRLLLIYRHIATSKDIENICCPQVNFNQIKTCNLYFGQKIGQLRVYRRTLH